MQPAISINYLALFVTYHFVNLQIIAMNLAHWR